MVCRKTFFSLVFVSLQTLFSFGQTSISGIVNDYWPVTSVDICNNRIALPVIAVGIAAGDKVLLIQMGGAEIDTTNTPTYGTVIDYRTAGNFELLTVSDVTINIITFEEVILNSYDPVNGRVQLVRVPEYGDVTIAATLTAEPWDGESGGVVALISSGTVTLNADIDVTGLGFLGGAIVNEPGCFSGGAGSSDYRCDILDQCGGRKGEGIGDTAKYELGRGAPANAGGGGNDNNTGGGGGSNFGIGGLGGQRLNTAPTDCQGTNPGIGGYALAYSGTTAKVFIGGGGGSGDDNTNESSAGANGGGLVLIRASTIDGTGLSIIANGATADTAHQDGAGGGGGAGSVLLDVANFASPVNVQLNGGGGGLVDNGLVIDSCFGPGGGGGAGLLWVSGGSVSANITVGAAGGQPGLTINGNAPAACAGSSNGATAGTAGGTLTGLVIPESTLPFVPLTLEISGDTAACIGGTASLFAIANGTGSISYQWSDGSNASSIVVTVTEPVTYTVTVTDSLGCSLTQSFQINITTNSVTAIAIPDSILVGQSVQLIADTVGNEFFIWFPPTGISDINDYNPTATPPDTMEYCVIATGYNGCVDTACVTVEVLIPEPAIFVPSAFTPNGDGLNDTWEIIVHPCYEITEMFVYSRWATTLFNFTSTGVPSWDGTYQGKIMPIGAYPYFIRAKCNEKDTEEIYRGNVTIIR